MDADVVIVGGGLSGLAATWQLHRHGIAVRLLEARDRTGGRVLSIPFGDSQFDYGPSWVWRGQPHVAGLLKHFGIGVYEQVCDGDLLQQTAEGVIHRNDVFKPMQGALRVSGGIAAICSAMRAQLPDEVVHCDTVVTALNSLNADDDIVSVLTQSGDEFRTSHIGLAVPLRIAAEVAFEPPLDEPAIVLMKSTPTWMSGQAKVFAFYPTQFWRQQGLSGDAFSNRGPLAEIHDATTEKGVPAALMGFVGIDGPAREAMTKPKLIEAARLQLVELFGQQAASPIKMQIMDWSTEPFTAVASDRISPSHHPQYGIKVQPELPWTDRVSFIVSETATENGGLVEGALQQGLGYACRIIQTFKGQADLPVDECESDPHTASMSWDWIK